MSREVKYALFASLLVVVGMLAGFKLNENMSGQKMASIDDGLEKFRDALVFVERNYVTEPESQDMVDDAIKGMLEGLDPHSFYIPAKEMKAMDEQMQGSFEGIGIEFNILEDTIYVVAPIHGGPSEKLGILSGDRIVKIDGETVAGIGITNSDVMKKLKGQKGTHVMVSIKRHGVKKLLDFDIERDKIPLYSVDFSYMINQNTGFIKVNRFSGTTYTEFKEHLEALKAKGMESLILDLRGNPGGYMEKAEKIADEFLQKGKLVVYTEGRMSSSRSRYKASADYNGFENGPLVILMDYGSASASEIVAGAVQDNDRGLILGVRSFGKGLVQTQKVFSDGSAMRLVISKYYTPSGRCIQKPYDKSSEEYDDEINKRFESGEIYDPSKIDFPDSLKFKTNSGRTVYGGGAIMPDIFVPRDTSMDSDYLTALIATDVMREYSFNLVDEHPEIFSKYANATEFVRNFELDDKFLDGCISFAEKKEIEFNEDEFKLSKPLIRNYLKAFIGRKLFNDEGFYPVLHLMDSQVKKALENLPIAKKLEETGTL